MTTTRMLGMLCMVGALSACSVQSPIGAPDVVEAVEQLFPTAAPQPPTANTPTVAPTVTPAARARAVAQLAALPVKGRAPKTGYDRAQFGQRWSDDVSVDGGHNGCDTRNDILRRDLTDVVATPGTRGCVVVSGTLKDPYTGERIRFLRGQDTSSQVQIDHVVALSNAWQTGAQRLSSQQRQNLANDPRNLLAVKGSANQQKGDGDAATWLPPNKSFRCSYVIRQIDVKGRYRLWVTPPERDAMAAILDRCSR